MTKLYDFKLITGSKIEFLFNRFPVVIIDMIQTRILSSLLNTNCRIIAFYPQNVDLTPLAEQLRGRILFITKLDEIYDAVLNFSKVEQFELPEKALLCSKYDSVSSHSLCSKFL